jgi:trans-aconitate methyltransferase
LTSPAPVTANLEKYSTRNPVVRALIDRFLRRVVRRTESARPARIVDIGCGEGFVARRLAGSLPAAEYLGIDRSPVALAWARDLCPDLSFVLADFLDLDLETGPGDWLLCLEVLEHLEHPRRILSKMASLPQIGAAISVPFEPYFRLGNLLRMKNVSRLGNDPEHVQQFGRRSFRRLVGEFYPHVEIEVSFPWLLTVARREL